MDNELTQPLGELSPLYSGGAEFIKRRGGTGHVVTDEDTNALRLATQIMRGQDQDLAQNRITAYHGSPYKFDQFDSSKIGSGEGAQAYGHGHYLAESEPVAKMYRDKLSSVFGHPEVLEQFFTPGEIVPSYGGKDKVIAYDPQTRSATVQSIDSNGNLGRIRTHGTTPDLKVVNDTFKERGLEPFTPGHMYEVAINTHPDYMLDWNKPAAEQHPHVLNAIAPLFPNGIPETKQYGEIFKGGDLYHEMKSRLGGVMYKKLADEAGIPSQLPGGTDERLGKYLSSQGVHGIKYFDANSRSRGDGTRNYVVFDPKNIEIMRRYARGGDVRHGYSTDGMVKPDNNTIEMPHSLKELQNWHKTHPAPKPMVRASDDPTSILYNERKLDMPNSLEELQNWARTHHASGGNVHDDIVKAMHLARTHFGFGGDSDAAEGSHYSENISHDSPSGEDRDRSFSRDYDSSLGRSDNGGGDFDGRMGRGQPETGGPIQHEVIGSQDFGRGLDFGGGNFTGHDMPTGLINYTTQRETTPYEGTPMTAAQDPSNAFGMAYPSLVGVHNTPAGAAALLANLGYESTQGGKAFQPNAISGSGYGLAQWTDPSRQAAFFNAMQPGTTANNPIAKMAILGTTTPGQQLGYALNEIQQKYPSVAREMATSTNRAATTENIMDKYESPATRESLDARIALANQIARGTGTGSFAREALNQSPSGSSFAAISPSVSSAVRNAVGAGRGDVGILDSSLAKATALNTANGSGAIVDEGAVNSATTSPQKEAVMANAASRIPVNSYEDPSLIAAYNAQYGLSGPKNTMADMALGQRIPNVATNNPLVNTVQNVSNFLTDRFTPNYNLGSEEYNKISQNPEPVRAEYEGRGGDRPQPYIPYIPPVATAAAAPVTPVAAYVPQTPYIPPAPQPYASLGANFVDPRVYQNPLFSQLFASGGKVHGNNAMGNAIRMAMGYKS